MQKISNLAFLCTTVRAKFYFQEFFALFILFLRFFSELSPLQLAILQFYFDIALNLLLFIPLIF